MVDSSQVATALLTEHLQYTPLSLIDDVINSVNNLVYQGISSLEKGLTATPPERLGFKPAPVTEPTPDTGGAQEPEYPDAKKEIEEGLHQLETLLENTVDKNFDKFEILVLRNVLCVPEGLEPWVRLKHYEDLPTPPPSNVTSPLTLESLNLIRRKIAAAARLRRSLQTEMHRNEALVRQLQGILGAAKTVNTGASTTTTKDEKQPPDFSFLTTAPSATMFNIDKLKSSQQPLTMNTRFALSQLPALRSLLAELRSRLVTVHPTRPIVKSAADERREERKQYIESRAMLHVDKDGDTNMLSAEVLKGKKIDPEEIAPLEKVAGILESS